jgi:hypothetical protein
MASAVGFIQWQNYQTGLGGDGLFGDDPLAFSSHQERLLALLPGDDLWLVSRCPEDQQYYFVAVLRVGRAAPSLAGSRAAAEFGPYSVVAERSRSHDLSRRFPAEGLLRALQFDTRRPIQFGASIGQSLQTLRVLDPTDVLLLNNILARLLNSARTALDDPFGLWTKCGREFADYFLSNWEQRREPLAFLLYDSPPALRSGAPVFIHSDKHLRLIAQFREAQYVSGHKQTVDAEERTAERERVWTAFRAMTLNPPTKHAFDEFWERESGVRALFLMDRISPAPNPSPFKVYGRALEWGFPLSVGHRYLSLSQCALLLRACGVEGATFQSYLAALL